MTVSSQTNKVIYIGNGVAKEFAIPFSFLEQEHIKVRQKKNDIQTERTDWTVKSGNLVFANAPESGAEIAIVREVPLTQETDYRDNEILHAETLERNFDKLTMQVQQLAEKSERAVTVDIFDDTQADSLIPSIRKAVSDCQSLAQQTENAADAVKAKADKTNPQLAGTVSINSAGTNHGLDITGPFPHIYLQDTTADGSAKQASEYIFWLSCRDKNNVEQARFDAYFPTESQIKARLGAKSPNGTWALLGAYANDDGTVGMEAPWGTSSALVSGGRPAVVKKSVVNGYGGYRLWTDGFKECWHSRSAATSGTLINFPVVFSNTNYTLTGTVCAPDATNVSNRLGWFESWNHTTSSFRMNLQYAESGASRYLSWYACGY